MDVSGSACLVLGAVSGVALTAALDDKKISPKLPYNNSAIAVVDNLAVGWHLLTLVIETVDTSPGKGIGSRSRSTSLEDAAVPVAQDTNQSKTTRSEGMTMAPRFGTMALDRVIVDTGISE